MSEIFALDFVRAALLLSVCMAVLLSFLGTHVVRRGIVFVDLALGQISMMGVAFAAYFEFDATTVAILFTLVGAFLMSLIKVSDNRLKLEAIIGILYAVSSAVTVLLISKAAHGDADIQEVLFGSFFTIESSELWWMAGVFSILGLVQLVFRKQFTELTRKFADGDTSDIGMFDVWNFLFYVSIGLAIVLAVRSGGVIPVFSFIVVPPVAAILITRNNKATAPIVLVIAVLGSVMGIYFSVQFDFPAGASIVAMFGVIFVAASLVRLARN